MEVTYTPHFVRQFNSLDEALQEEIIERIEEFKNTGNHQKLKVHPLKGRLKGKFSFSVNYAYRIVFEFSDKKRTAICLAVGDHDIYL